MKHKALHFVVDFLLLCVNNDCLVDYLIMKGNGIKPLQVSGCKTSLKG